MGLELLCRQLPLLSQEAIEAEQLPIKDQSDLSEKDWMSIRVSRQDQGEEGAVVLVL